MTGINAATALFDGAGGIPLGSILSHHAARDPDRAALIVGDLAISRADLDARSTRRARAISGRVRSGDLVVLALPNGAEFYETSFALWKLGAVPTVVSQKLAQGELEAIVALAEPALVIGLDPARLPGRAVLPAGLPIDESLSAEPLPAAVSPNWKAMTSGGSTGRPKIIVDTMPGLWDPAVTAFGQEPDDIILNPGPLYHNAPFCATHYGLFTGATVIEMGKFDALGLLQLAERHRVQWIALVPTMMQRLMRLDPALRARFDLSHLRMIFHLASMCPPWLKQAYIDWLGPERVIELYAGTERQGATMITGTEWLAKPGSVGRAQPGSRIAVLREDGSPCAAGEVGEIHFLPDAGPGTTYRYIGSEPRRSGDWETLGDLGWLDADGYLYLADRRTDLIVSGGANIYPAEVEGALEAPPDVASCIVIGLPDPEWGASVHAIVERAPGSPVTAEALLAFAAERLTRYKLPKSIEFADGPLRDDASKARRWALREERL